MFAMRFLVLYLLIVASASAANDLTPVGPRDMEARELLFGQGKRDGWWMDAFWMIRYPSFFPPSLVYLDGRKGANVVHAAVAKEQIYQSKPSATGGEDEYVLRTDLEITRRERPIEVVLLDRLKNLWTQAVKRARYPDKRVSGVDGVSYEFYAPLDCFGQTWLPDGGIAKAMVDLERRSLPMRWMRRTHPRRKTSRRGSISWRRS